jgi:hypothetical protein
MKVTLSKAVLSKKVVLGEVTEVEIVSFTDDPDHRRVTCIYRLGAQARQSILLWDGDAYDAAGQYTDADVALRLDALLTVEGDGQ